MAVAQTSLQVWLGDGMYPCAVERLEHRANNSLGSVVFVVELINQPSHHPFARRAEGMFGADAVMSTPGPDDTYSSNLSTESGIGLRVDEIPSLW